MHAKFLFFTQFVCLYFLISISMYPEMIKQAFADQLSAKESFHEFKDSEISVVSLPVI